MKTNKIYKLVTGFVLIAFLGLTSCEKQEVIKVIGFVQGYVYDANTNEVLDNVTVSWEMPNGVADSTVATAAEGFSIDNLPSGNYILKCSKANYATSTIEVDIPKDDIAVSIKGGGSKEYVVDVIPKLYSLDANVTGRVYKYDDYLFFGYTSPASNAKVKLIYSFGAFLKSEYETTTDEDGYYSFENVPSAVAKVLIPSYVDNTQHNYYQYATDNYMLSSGSTTVISSPLIPVEFFGTDRMSFINSNLFVAPNVGTNQFPLSDNITLEFTRDVNEEVTNFFNNYWGSPGFRLYNYSSAVYVPFTLTYSGNTVTIDPDTDLNPDEVFGLSCYYICGDRVHDITWIDEFQFRTAASK